jgi:DNA polymerase
MKKLSIDIETFSETDLTKTGVYRYAEDPAFEILLFGVAVDEEPVKVYDLTAGEKIPGKIMAALQDEQVEKWAFNAMFERVCLSRFLRDRGLLPKGQYLSPEGWKCSMIWSAYMGFPMSLAGSGAALGLEQQKMTEGKDLIRYFCVPCKATASNGGRVRNLPSDAPDKWETFVAYNRRDVEVELQIKERLSSHPVPDQVWREYWNDQRINDRGIQIDLPMVRQAIHLDALSQQHLTDALQELTNLDNPRSVQQMKDWLASQGMEMDSLGKKVVAEALRTAPEPLRTVLTLRQQLAMSAVKKYTAMEAAVCADGRLRGMFRFYGANRSGRFSGTIVQLQNLFRNSLPDLIQARSLVSCGDYAALEILYDSVPQVLAECVRTAFIPAPGYKMIVADFSAIECRVLAWLAGEQWVLDVFSAGGDIYCETASRMFHVPVVKHGENGELRQKGKQATLSCGYGGAEGALIAMGALDAGMKQEELAPLVAAWREANPRIVQMWWAVDRAVKTAVKEKTVTRTHGLTFEYRGAMLYITLPSGRQLSYVKPRIGENRFGGESVTYMGMDTTKHWSRIESFAGKWVENIVQAVARDILCYAMEQLSGYRIVAHVHDECIVECPQDTTVEEICDRMSTVPPWAPGLILRADGYECPGFYMKD